MSTQQTTQENEHAQHLIKAIQEYQKKTGIVIPTDTRPVKRLELFDDKGNPTEFKKIKIRNSSSLFKKSAKFQKVIDLVGEEGPAFSKAAFMVGTAFETAYAGWMAGKPSSVTEIAGLIGESLPGLTTPQGHIWLISIIVWGVGLMFETAFAFSWIRTGSSKLAGDQVDINNDIFDKCRLIMAGGLIAAVISTLFSAQILMNAYLALMMFGAVHILHLQHKLKLADPRVQAKQEQTDLQADWEAAWIREGGKEQDLYLKKTEHERNVERRELAIKNQEEMKILSSRKYRKQAEENARNRFLSPGKSGPTISIIEKAKQLLNMN